MAGAVTLVFTALGRVLRGVSFSGAIAGAVLCFAMYVAAGPGAIAVLASVFALTWVATRFGYSRKKHLGTAEDKQGRTASQILANLAVAAACSILSAITGKSVFLLVLLPPSQKRRLTRSQANWARPGTNRPA